MKPPLSPIIVSTNSDSTPTSNVTVLTGTGRKQVYWTMTVLIGFFMLGGMITLFYEQEFRTFTNWVVGTFGFLGLAGLSFVGDIFASPLPPDFLLLIIAKSELRELWYLYVPAVGVLSTTSGVIGYFIGMGLRSFRYTPRGMIALAMKNQQLVRHYGVGAVILGACTPLPFSLTCWTAGFMAMDMKRFLMAVSIRAPRIIIYYLVIHYSDLFRYL